MKLYVDDLRKCPEGWVLARTNTEAIRMLATGYVEEISVDHDICVPRVDFISQSVRKRLAIGEETYQPVAYYIAAMPKPNLIKVNFHTANPDGAAKMKSILEAAGIKSTYAQGSYKIDFDGTL
jgi:hypothetical protein